MTTAHGAYPCPYCGHKQRYDEAMLMDDDYRHCVQCGRAIVWTKQIYPRPLYSWSKPAAYNESGRAKK